MRKSSFLRLSASVALLLLMSSPVIADEFDSIKILRVSAQDQRAVIKDTDGATRLVKTGDAVGKHGEIVEIAPARIVIQEKNGTVPEKIIVRLVDGQQKVTRLKSAGENAPLMFAPAESRTKRKKGTPGIM